STTAASTRPLGLCSAAFARAARRSNVLTTTATAALEITSLSNVTKISDRSRLPGETRDVLSPKSPSSDILKHFKLSIRVAEYAPPPTDFRSHLSPETGLPA